MLKTIPSELICQELNYRYGRMNRKSVPELVAIETEKLVTELISRSGLERSWESKVEINHVSKGQMMEIRLFDDNSGKTYVKEFHDKGFVITFI